MQPVFNVVVMEHFSLKDWLALYDDQKEMGAEMVVDNHPRLLRLLECLTSHMRYKGLPHTDVLACRSRAWSKMGFKVIDFDWAGSLELRDIR